MGLFKSREERRIERDIQIRQAVSQIKRQIATSEKHETGYIDKAKRARQIGAATQYEFLKKAIKKSRIIRVRLEQQLLTLETAVQVKEQAEGQYDFAKAMTGVSNAISEVFGAADMTKVQTNFEKAMAQAQTMEERTDAFLAMTSESMFGYEGSPEGEPVTDEEIEKMLSREVEHEERGGDDELTRDIASITREIDKLKK